MPLRWTFYRVDTKIININQICIILNFAFDVIMFLLVTKQKGACQCSFTAKDNTALRLITAHEVTVIVICILDLLKTMMGTSFVATLCSTFRIFPIISEKLCTLYTYIHTPKPSSEYHM